MFCNKCGARLAEDAVFCTVCGTRVASASCDSSEPVKTCEANEQTDGAYNANPISFEDLSDSAISKIITAFSSSAFLALCILFTISVGAAALTGSIDIINILFAVGLWLIRTAAVTNNTAGFSTPFRMISALTTIGVVLRWIAVGLLLLSSVIFFVAGIMAPPFDELMAEVDSREAYEVIMIESGAGLDEIVTYDDFMTAWNIVIDFLMMGGLIIFGSVMVVIAIILALVNIFCYHSIRRCAKSFVNAYNTNEKCFVSVNTVANWLLVLGVLEIVSAVGTLSSFDIMLTAASGAGAAGMITASQLLKKYFV